MQQAISYSRFSTGTQQHGTSLSRQNQMVAEYCNKNNLILIDSFHDAGKSGFHAKHLKEGGQLRLLLDRVKDGTIPRGIHLLVEQTDRLTRQAVFEGLGVIQELINAGLIIVTLDDGQIYDSNTDFGKIIMLLARLQRGHDESKAKSDRLSYVWSGKAKQMNEEKLPKMRMPFWLKRDGESVSIDPNWKVVVDIIIQGCIDGKGCAAIAMVLNRKGIKTKADANWTASSITQLIRNRRLIGWHQRRESKELFKIYPPILSIETFNKAQAALDTRVRSKGNTQKWSSALSGLTRCGACGSTLKFSGKAKYRTAVCRAAVDGGAECTNKKSIRYRALILGTVLGMGWDIAISRTKESNRPSGERESLTHELDAIKGRINNLVAAIALTDDVPAIAVKLNEQKEQEKRLKVQLATLVDPVDVDTLFMRRFEIIKRKLPKLTTGVLEGEKDAANEMNILLHTLGDVEITLLNGVASVGGVKVWLDGSIIQTESDDWGRGIITNTTVAVEIKTIERGTPDNPRTITIEIQEQGQPLGGGYRYEQVSDE